MAIDKVDAAYTVGSWLAIYAAFHFVSALSFPRFFMRRLAFVTPRIPANHLEPTLFTATTFWLRFALTVVATGYLAYRTTAPFADWIPFDWGSHDEDDIWTSARESVRFWLSIAVTIWALVSCQGAASALDKVRPSA